MDFAFSEEQEMLRRSARDFLGKECPPKVVRAVMAGETGYDPGLWKKLAGLGWTALGIPEQYGGAGAFFDLIGLFLIKGRPSGMTVSPLETMDQTRRWSEIRFEGVSLGPDSLMGAPHSAWPGLKRALEWGTAALCAEMVGGAQKVLEASSEYA